MSPRAWRWNSETPSSCSSAETCRDTADCDNPNCSPAWVKLPASAAAWKTFSLSQFMFIGTFVEPSFRGDRGLRFAVRRNKGTSRTYEQQLLSRTDTEWFGPCRGAFHSWLVSEHSRRLPT